MITNRKFGSADPINLFLGSFLVHRATRHHARIQFDLSERAFVTPHILLQDAEEGLCLLGAQVDSLEILDFHLGLALLQQSSEHEEEIPHIHADLYAVNIVLAIVTRVRQLDIGLNWIGHRAASLAGYRNRGKSSNSSPGDRGVVELEALGPVTGKARPFGHPGRVPQDGQGCTPVLLLLASNRGAMLLQQLEIRPNGPLPVKVADLVRINQK